MYMYCCFKKHSWVNAFSFSFFFHYQVRPWRSTCALHCWLTKRSSCSWRKIAYPNISSSSTSSWGQWPDPIPQAGLAPLQLSWAGMAGPRAPAHTASSAAAPRSPPLCLPQRTVRDPPRRKRRRMEGFFSTLIDLVFLSRVSPGRGCGPMWRPCTLTARRWWTGYEMLHTFPR